MKNNLNRYLVAYALVRAYALDSVSARRLFSLICSEHEPVSLLLWVKRGMAVFAAALAGFGLILWIAANWDNWSTQLHFALLLGLFGVTAIGAAIWPGVRHALGLLAFFALGGLWAYFGQTYQTGADPWQLFAVWALLSLPLMLGVRHDVLWLPWVLVCMTGISLWFSAEATGRGGLSADFPDLYLYAWGMALLLCLGLSPVFKAWTGSGCVSFRTVATLSVILVAGIALMGLYSREASWAYLLAVVLLLLSCLLVSRRPFFDFYLLSMLTLALNILLVNGLIYALLFRNTYGLQEIGLALSLFLVGALGLLMLAGSVSFLLRLHATVQMQDAGRAENHEG